MSCGIEGFFCKVDFEKAYNHVRWDFFDFVLENKGFGSRWRYWIRGCLSSSNFSVVVICKPGNMFKASRGLCQDDRLSHFLFSLVVDVLSKFVDIGSSMFEGFTIWREAVSVSHLQFVYDILFFASGDELNLFNLPSICQAFELVD